MDPKGWIYEGTEEKPVKPEDAARLDGYLKGRAESDALAKKEGEDIKALLAEKQAEMEKTADNREDVCP